MEGVKCLVYGRPKSIPQEKLGVYFTYAAKFVKPGIVLGGGAKGERYEILDEDDNGELQKSME
jgi:hypothetical protein